MEAYYAMQWPRENLFCTGYIHEVMNFRYNWHETEYELNILLHGRAEYCRDGESWQLEEDDMILIDPGVGHASFALESDTYALVLRVSASAFRALLPPGQGYSFQHFVTDASNRYRSEFNLLRYCAARFLESASRLSQSWTPPQNHTWPSPSGLTRLFSSSMPRTSRKKRRCQSRSRTA